VRAEAESPESSGATPTAAAADDGSPDEPAAGLPVYGWLERVQPAPPADGDWTRELVRGKETPGDDDRRA
jgi:hypothetical protein